MLDWFRSWSKGIIVAVIISTIIEMILPDNTSKKYIKIVIGLFIVYTIISPLIDQFVGKNIDEYLAVNDYIEASANIVEDNNISNSASNSIKTIYKQNLENDLKIKLKDQGYIVESISISISDGDSYNIDNIDIKIEKKETVENQEREVQGIVENIKSIKIKLDRNSDNNDSAINDEDKNKIKEYVKNTYEIDINKVCVS